MPAREANQAYDWDVTARPLHYLVVAVALVALLIAALLAPGSNDSHVAWMGDDLSMPCSMQVALGVPCWACGMTRAFVSGVRGEFAAAWAFNPAGLWLLTLAALQLPYRAVRIRRPGLLPGAWQPDVAMAAVSAVVVLATWVVRLSGGLPLP